jgi:hypothetical protein
LACTHLQPNQKLQQTKSLALAFTSISKGEPGQGASARLLTRYEARRIAANVAKPLPELLSRRQTASLNERPSPKGLHIFANPKYWHVSARTMRDTAMR